MQFALFAQAAPSNDTRIVRFLFDNIGGAVTSFANDGAASLIGFIGPVAVSLLTIYVLLWGVAMASGQISEPFTDGMKRIIRMCIIVGFALTAGIYQSTVVDLFQQAPAQMANAMTSGTEFAADYESTNDLAEMLDNSLAEGFKIAGDAYKKGEEEHSKSMMGISATGLVYQFLALLLCIISLIIVAVAAGVIFVAYLALAILLAIGPLFIMMAIFPGLQRWFETWLGQTVNFALLFVMEALAAALLFKMLTAYLQSLSGYDAPIYEVLMICLKAVGLTIACIAVLVQMTGIAGALAGGASIQAANIAGKLAGAGFAAAAAGRTGIMSGMAFRAGAKGQHFDRHKTDSERLGGAVRTGMEMARRRFTGSNTAAKG
ncbi:type IV secretion system protein [Luteimonas soli]|uniref:Type IV secretion system protein n=1 Tax=Luteimonas soli TaxID=1648966 RepID=A0ABV7XG74_9GAMM